MFNISKNTALISILVIANNVFAYGPIGHRAIAKIAESYLTGDVKHKITELLDGDNIITVSTYADDIKSDKNFDYTRTWHYVNVMEGKSYVDSEKNDGGDIIVEINRCIEVLKSKEGTKEEKSFRLKMLVHLIGDLHQPLHCGRAVDRGGNDIKVTWFGENTNLHRVWDSDMINSQKMSYTEIAESMKRPPYINTSKIEEGNIVLWYEESKKISKEVYSSVKPYDNLYYGYRYKYYPIIKNQINYAGIRLARVLNDIFK